MSKTIKVQSKPFFKKNNDMDRLSSDLIVYIYSFTSPVPVLSLLVTPCHLHHVRTSIYDAIVPPFFFFTTHY